MREKFTRLIFILAFVLTATGGISLCLEELLPQHREWLEDVSPIITNTEREIFLKLKTDAEREKFIRFFWRQRDPFPDTKENEFYKEYMDRIRFADQNFGHETSKRGSQTERGYYYLLLGPPLERQFFTTQSQLWPLELWYYKGEIEYGLPPYFYLIFYQPGGLGEYRLYSPGVEGPEKLIVPGAAPRTLSRTSAYQLIKKISSELASASLSYLPGEGTPLAPAFSSASLLASVRSLAEKKFSDAYARSYLNYKDYVETEYSHAYIESGYSGKIFWQGSGFFLHWTVEPKKINLVARGEKFQAIFDLVLRLEDRDGHLVLEKEEEIPLALTAEQVKQHGRRPFAFQDILPVIPGRFRLLGLLKNKTAQDFTSFNAEIVVPEARPPFGPVLLYHSRERVPLAEGRGLRAFTFDGTHYLVNASNEFAPTEEMGVYIQMSWLDRSISSASRSVLIEIRQVDRDEPVLSQKRDLKEAGHGESPGADIGTFSLALLKPGYYAVEVSLVGEQGKKIYAMKENFILLARVQPVLPWVYARIHGPAQAGEHLCLFASQYFMVKKYEKAAGLAEQALKLKEEPATRLLYARSLFALGRFEEAIKTVLPLEEEAPSREAAKLIAASYASLKDWRRALVYLERLMAEATETSVLNQTAECYLHLDELDRAIELLRRSLELDPDQPAIKALLETAEKKAKK
ncbi:MAG: GWxTD domain-containing protein [Candidatus Aminicenantales bacterium]